MVRATPFKQSWLISPRAFGRKMIGSQMDLKRRNRGNTVARTVIEVGAGIKTIFERASPIPIEHSIGRNWTPRAKLACGAPPLATSALEGPLQTC